MGKKAPKAPAAPSPQATAEAQGKVDKETAYYNALLQNMDQVTPYGNLTYQNLGSIDAPKWQSTISLSPEQQALFASQNRQDAALNALGEQQIGRIGQSVSTPFSFGGIKNALPTYDDIAQQQTAAEEALMSRMNPQFARDEEAMRTRLINQGIGQGSEAYRREMEQFGQNKNDARTQAILSAQQFGSNAQNMALQRRLQEIDEYVNQRNAPLNEYIGLTSGTQIVNPQFSAGGNQGINSFDMAGAMNNSYNAAMNNYNNQVAARNNRTGAMTNLFGLGGNLIGGPTGGFIGSAVGSLFSDARLKENIEPFGFENGYPLYKFNYINIPEKTYIGVMAQDVSRIDPDAITESEGFMKVDYDKIGVSFREAF